MVYLHYAHAIGLERLAALMGELFAVSNQVKAPSATCWPVRVSRCWQRLQAIRETVMASDVLCDETLARVTEKTWWEWVFVGTLAALRMVSPQAVARP